MKPLQEMSKPEKKKFLSMDLAERMIRIEQNVSASFNKYVPYNKTEYYLSMSDAEKEEFEKFLRNKKGKKILSILSLIIPLSIFVFLTASFTGNVIKETIGTGYYISIIVITIIVFILVIFIITHSVSYNKSMALRLHKHVMVINHIIHRREGLKK